MKKILMLCIIVFGMTMVGSCGPEDVLYEEEKYKPGTDTVISPSKPEQESNIYKSYSVGFSYRQIEANKDFNLVWSDKEEVTYYIISENGKKILFERKIILTSSSVSGLETANLSFVDSIKTTENRATGFGFSPCSNIIVNGTRLTGSINNMQNQDISDYKIPMSVMGNMIFTSYTSVLFDLKNGMCELNFSGMFSILKMKVSRNSSMPFNGKKIKTVKLYSANINDIKTPLNKVIAGKYQIDFEVSDAKAVFYAPQYEISANITNSPEIISGTLNNPTIWLIVNPVEFSASEKFVAEITTTEEDIIRIPFSVGENLKRNKMYEVNLEVSNENTYVNRLNDKYSNIASNCYLISKSDYYKIPAKTISGTPLSGTKIDWLWASKEGGNADFDVSELIDLSSLSYDGNYITFRVGKAEPLAKLQKGNVILALKDAAGNIVWTWHIWITDEPKNTRYRDGWFMDRNLGALTTDTTRTGVDVYGFMYKWGHRMPLFGGDGQTADEGGEGAFGVASRHSKLNTGVSWSDLWNTSETGTWTLTKSDYDPCPNGYRVPTKDELHEIDKNTNFMNISNKYWCWAENENFIPAAGMRSAEQNGVLKYSGTDEMDGQCYYWSSTPCTIEPNTSYRLHTRGNVIYSSDEYGNNTDAYSVRCVVDK